MNPNGFTFDKLRLESLNRQAVESRGAVEQHRMTTRDLLQNVPNFRRLPFDHLLGRADGMHVSKFFQTPDNERLKQDQRHLLGQAALVQLEFRPNDDYRTS